MLITPHASRGNFPGNCGAGADFVGSRVFLASGPEGPQGSQLCSPATASREPAFSPPAPEKAGSRRLGPEGLEIGAEIGRFAIGSPPESQPRPARLAPRISDPHFGQTLFRNSRLRRRKMRLRNFACPPTPRSVAEAPKSRYPNSRKYVGNSNSRRSGQNRPTREQVALESSAPTVQTPSSAETLSKNRRRRRRKTRRRNTEIPEFCRGLEFPPLGPKSADA